MQNYYVIIDCDPGIDDAMAIMNALNSHNIEVKLISVVAGNLNIKETAKNALKLVEIFGADVPVSVGASEPMKRQPAYASMAQGNKGFGGYQYEEVSLKPISLKGSEALHYYLHDNLAKNTTILCMGPMTNIAKLLIDYPEDRNYISRIVFMGGSKDENGSTAPYREFNIAFDPEAVEIVLKSNIDLVMIPMELGHIAYFEKEEQGKIKRANKVGKIFAKMFSKYNDYHVGKLGAAVHDSCSALFLSNPEIFHVEPAMLSLKYYKDKKSGIDYGYINCDFGCKKKNALVAVDMDIEKFKKIIYGNLFNYN